MSRVGREMEWQILERTCLEEAQNCQVENLYFVANSLPHLFVKYSVESK